MEIHPLHEVTKGFWLKGREARVTNLPAEERARGRVGANTACQASTGSGCLLHQRGLSRRRSAVGDPDNTPRGLLQSRSALGNRVRSG